MENSYPQYITKEAIEMLDEKLNLAVRDKYSQDWQYEVSDPSRVSEFILFYEDAILNNEEKFALMSLIISSLDDALEEGYEISGLWGKISHHLVNEIKIHYNTIQYWALLEEDLDNCFAVTPLIRDVAKKYLL
ncbi:hypothetical protein [Paenibacillus radicis (ex Xue et al. 2023)]|uniref:Uncharacterized protein n=1 Tax=Paenibacillus radicis (ex Xue et al. 2023) TaxID=2972489 RepID=A0ABT1YCE9_9BACL|nr:hypothetical protein [Paenibacillus radicis (ex Xue et al. 2023)]MCR8630880.1 hypothetical protein [Paenibacillus radicis (ex Xue et al. 2023)]